MQLSDDSDAEAVADNPGDDQYSVDDNEAILPDEISSPPTPPPRPRLKIKLKLPAVPSSGTSTPQVIGSTREASRGELLRFSFALDQLKASIDVDVESEDEDPEIGSSTNSSGAGPSTKPMTARQAVLASVVDSSHVSLREPSFSIRTSTLFF
jgi:Ino eighty subunit 2